MTPPVSQRGALLAKIGAWMQVAQVVGFIASVRNMNQAYATAGTTLKQATEIEAALQDTAALSANMSSAFNYFLAGIGIAALGLILVIIAATVYRYRATWFFWFLCLYGGAMIMSYMFPFGVFLVYYALKKKNEFELDPPSIPGTMVR